MKYALLLAVASSSTARGWEIINFGYWPHYTMGPVTGPAFDFPQAVRYGYYPAFFICTNGPMNLSGEVIATTFTVTATPGAEFRCGVPNSGSLPPNARLFFSSVTGYNNAGTGSTNYWFHSAWVEISTNAGTATLVATFNREDWSDAGGCADCPPVLDSDFWHAVANVCEVGIAMGQGSFYDVGLAVTNGAASLSIDRFTVSEKFRNYRRCFTD